MRNTKGRKKKYSKELKSILSDYHIHVKRKLHGCKVIKSLQTKQLFIHLFVFFLVDLLEEWSWKPTTGDLQWHRVNLKHTRVRNVCNYIIIQPPPCCIEGLQLLGRMCQGFPKEEWKSALGGLGVCHRENGARDGIYIALLHCFYFSRKWRKKQREYRISISYYILDSYINNCPYFTHFPPPSISVKMKCNAILQYGMTLGTACTFFLYRN